jgi:hypothetical protein
MNQAIQTLKPTLPEPFPNTPRYWKDPKTGLLVPKRVDENIEWRTNLLQKAEKDEGLQKDLIAASAESLLFWINAFCWTFHQFDVDPVTGKRVLADSHVPFISWEIQDRLFDKFDKNLVTGEDILIDKCRDMGASWICVDYLHHQWLFVKDSQMLEMSRVKEYVDHTGNMKALFQKHDYINAWLPTWMLPPECLPGQKYRTSMHMHNVVNGSTIDGESTTPHAGSGDRRKILLLDEFAKVEHGGKMRSATRDVAFMRIINSTPAGAGTEYSRWKNSGQIKVFQLPFYEHPEKGAGRYVQEDGLGGWEITSPWLENEKMVRSQKELAQEVLMQDIESGDTFFTVQNIYKHKALFAKEPHARLNISLKSAIANEDVKSYIRRKEVSASVARKSSKGALRWWGPLICGRPDQSKSYRFGIDVSKGQGASNSVISIKCCETNEKVGEWRDANTPPYDMARVAVALALWVGGKKPHSMPFMKWEMNGPGWDFGRQVVRTFNYPYYYKQQSKAEKTPKDSKKYGWHASRDSKMELLMSYDRALAHGGYINHSEFGLDEMLMYIYYSDGGIGPASLVEENASARKTHGDVVIADALTMDESDKVITPPSEKIEAPYWSPAYRKKHLDAKRRGQRQLVWNSQFDFRT